MTDEGRKRIRGMLSKMDKSSDMSDYTENKDIKPLPIIELEGINDLFKLLNIEMDQEVN